MAIRKTASKPTKRAARPSKPRASRPAEGAPPPSAPVFGEDEADDAPSDAPSVAAPKLVRLNKYLADRGIASRRKCDELIQAGKVSVDGEPVSELGVRIDPERQAVEIDGFVLKPEGMRKRYYLLNKPAGIVCTNDEREMRPRAVDLITDPRKGRIYTVGRLDEESKGLILLTNDGDFANRIMHPRYGIEKMYTVRVLGEIDDETLNKIRDGVHLSDGRTAGARILVDRRTREYSMLTIFLREGMNREIRRVFARFGYKVVDLRRTKIGNLTERGIKVGKWRELTRGEVDDLVSGRVDAEEARRPAPRGRGTGRSAGRSDSRARSSDARGAGPRRGSPKARGGARSFAPRGGADRESPVRSGETRVYRGDKRDGESRGPAARGGDARRPGARGGDARRPGSRGRDARGSSAPSSSARRFGTGDERPTGAGARRGAPRASAPRSADSRRPTRPVKSKSAPRPDRKAGRRS